MSHAWARSKSGPNTHSWSQIDEDEEGNLLLSGHILSSAASQADQIRIRRKRLSRMDHAQTSRRIRRDMIRYVYIVLDLSEAIYEKDAALGVGTSSTSCSSDGGVQRTRIDVILELLQELVVEYFSQNPLSHLGLVICKNGESQILCPLSGNKRNAMIALAAIRDGMLMGGQSKKDAGVFSLQNGLRVAGLSLGFMPEYGSREVIVFVAAISTCDPGDILVETVPELQKARIRVNCLAMSAEIHVCKKICEQTGGIMGVALDRRHLRDLVMGLVTPPPIDMSKAVEEPTCEFIPMGFPVRETEDIANLMHSASTTSKRESKLTFARTGYICPQCKTKASELPVDCTVCGLKLVLAPHLARSFHHLFPVPPFEEVLESNELCIKDKRTTIELRILPMASMTFPSLPPVSKLGFSNGNGIKEVVLDTDLLLSSEDCDRCCFSCLKPIGLKIVYDIKKKRGRSMDKQDLMESSLRFQCPECKNLFCADCDAFIHETLHNCPGCTC